MANFSAIFTIKNRRGTEIYMRSVSQLSVHVEQDIMYEWMSALKDFNGYDKIDGPLTAHLLVIDPYNRVVYNNKFSPKE
jgi:hypothetical protein